LVQITPVPATITEETTAPQVFLSIYQDGEQGPAALYLSGFDEVLALQNALESVVEQALATTPSKENDDA
jgi:hypothetical protein